MDGAVHNIDLTAPDHSATCVPPHLFVRRMVKMTSALRICALLLLAAGCAGGEDRVCNSDADCASGMCRADGTCASVPGVDAGAARDATARDDGAVATDAGARSDGGGMRDAAIPGCVPNRDGVIERIEVPLEAGLRATFRVATDATFDTSGDVQPDGSRTWDLSVELAGERDVLVETLGTDGFWFASDFPGASYATELSVREDLLGVFDIGADELSLLGVASPDDGVARTNVSHDPPVRTLVFPLREGDRWSTDATVSGVASGVFATWNEEYESVVDARGELITPFGTFPVLRVRVVLTRAVGFATTVIRTFAFVSECFGTVATVTSRDNESREEFAEVAELRRLAP